MVDVRPARVGTARAQSPASLQRSGPVLLLADAVLALRREIVFGGVISDTRGPEIVIKTDKRLDAGVILVISSSSTNLYEREDFANPSDLVAALVKKGK